LARTAAVPAFSWRESAERDEKIVC